MPTLNQRPPFWVFRGLHVNGRKNIALLPHDPSQTKYSEGVGSLWLYLRRVRECQTKQRSCTS